VEKFFDVPWADRIRLKSGVGTPDVKLTTEPAPGGPHCGPWRQASKFLLLGNDNFKNRSFSTEGTISNPDPNTVSGWQTGNIQQKRMTRKFMQA
jgi:hypothetical protein